MQQLKRNTRSKGTAGIENETFQQPSDLTEQDNTKKNRGSIKAEIWREKKGWIVLLFCNNEAHVFSLQVILCYSTLQELSSSYSIFNPPSSSVKKVTIIFILHVKN